MDTFDPGRGILLRRCDRLVAALPDDGWAFSHRTAAALLRLLPATGDTLEVSHWASGRRCRRAEVVGHRVRARSTSMVAGLPVTAPIDTWLDLAATTSDRVLDPAVLLVVADRLLAGGPGRPALVGSELISAADAWHGRGATALRWAAELARPGACCGLATRARLRLLRHGWPPPTANVRSADGRHWPLGWPASRVGLRCPQCRPMASGRGGGWFTARLDHSPRDLLLALRRRPARAA